MPQEPSCRPQPQYWIKFLDPWVHDFYPVLGWGLETLSRERHSSQYRHWIKVSLPNPETLSETLRGFRARRARETPVRGGWGPNAKTQINQNHPKRRFSQEPRKSPTAPRSPYQMHNRQGAHQGGHATRRCFLEGILEGSLPVGASQKGSQKAPVRGFQ